MISIRIAIFTDSYKPQINGLVKSVESFTKYLRKYGHEVHIFAPKVNNYKENDKFVHRYASFEFIPYPEYKIAFPVSLFFTELFKEKKFDIIHIQSPFSMGLIGTYAANHYKIPAIATYHTNYQDYLHYLVKPKQIENILNPLAKKVAWNYLRFFFNKCSCVIAPTDYVKKILNKKGIKNIVVIPTGIEITKNKNNKYKLRKKYRFLKNDKIVLHVGRVTKEKNIEEIIKSIDNDVKLIIASDGPYKNELMKKYSKENIIFTGYLSGDILKDYYKMSDLFVMASKTETQGLVLLEAAVNNLPVIVLDAPVIGEFVRETKIGIATKNLRKDIKKFFVNRNVHNKLKINRVELIKKYDIKKCTRDLIRLYKSSLSGKVL